MTVATDPGVDNTHAWLWLCGMQYMCILGLCKQLHVEHLVCVFGAANF